MFQDPRHQGRRFGASCPSESELESRLAVEREDPDQALKRKLAAASYGFGSVSGGSPGRPVAQMSMLSDVSSVIEEAILDRFRDIPPDVRSWLKGPRRKLTDLTIDLWELGWQPHVRRVVIPVRDMDGQLVGLTGRALDEDQEPKFLHSSGFHRDRILFGEHLVEVGEVGYLVEGHFDAMYLRQMGYPNAVAMMGSFLAERQARKMAQLFSSVVVVPDGDVAGGRAAVQAEAVLRTVGVEVRVAQAFEGRDPDDLDQDELDEMLGL